MKFGWSLVLLASILFSAGVPIFFGHALATQHEKGTWYGASLVCFLIAAALYFVQVRFRKDEQLH